MSNDPIVIVGLARTPTDAFQGELKGFAAAELGAAAFSCTRRSATARQCATINKVAARA